MKVGEFRMRSRGNGDSRLAILKEKDVFRTELNRLSKAYSSFPHELVIAKLAV